VIHQDYFMRQVAQFVQVLLHVLGLSKKKRYQAALEAIHEAFQEVLGLSYDSASAMSEEVLVEFLTLGEMATLGREKCVMAATLFKEAGVIYAAQRDLDESYECYLKALRLLLAVLLDGDGVGLPDYAPGVGELTAALREYILPVETKAMLFRYYEQTGAYAKAEDTLFEMIEMKTNNADMVEIGVAFYERLRQQEDEILTAGNLPRDEVEAGLAELQTYRLDK
jgi:tetratricopeptide (TPR) repeat protein